MFSLHQVVDRQHNNVVASIFEHPTDWQARSELVWNFQQVSFPMIAYAQAYDLTCWVAEDHPEH